MSLKNLFYLKNDHQKYFKGFSNWFVKLYTKNETSYSNLPVTVKITEPFQYTVTKPCITNEHNSTNFISVILLEFVSYCKDCRAIRTQCYKTSHNKWTQIDSRTPMIDSVGWVLAAGRLLLQNTITVCTISECCDTISCWKKKEKKNSNLNPNLATKTRRLIKLDQSTFSDCHSKRIGKWELSTKSRIFWGWRICKIFDLQ